MGADIFYTFGSGKTAQEAFAAAREHEAWEHGHGGYTGSLAEKSDFTTIGTVVLSEADAYDLADRLIHDADPRIDDKWGPAGCIEVASGVNGTRRFLFFGWASS